MQHASLAGVLLGALHGAGAREVFGIPGDFALPFFDALVADGRLPLYTLSHEPSVGFAAVKLLEASGCIVEVPEAQTCCGQPAYNSGELPLAREMALQTVRAFAGYDYVVAPSNPTVRTIRQPPERIPAVIAEAHMRMTQKGTAKVDKWPLRTRSRVMMPILFCASLAP